MYDTIKAVEIRCSLSIATATYKLFTLFLFFFLQVPSATRQLFHISDSGTTLGLHPGE